MGIRQWYFQMKNTSDALGKKLSLCKKKILFHKEMFNYYLIYLNLKNNFKDNQVETWSYAVPEGGFQ